MRVPVVARRRVRIGNVTRDADVEHLAQSHLPLLHQARRRENQQPSHPPGRQQRRKDETGFNGLAKPYVVRDKPASRPLLQHALADPQLVRQQRDAGTRKHAPCVVHRADAVGKDASDHGKRRIAPAFGQPSGEVVQLLYFAGKALL